MNPTCIPQKELREIFNRYFLDEDISYSIIKTGIENTNYLLKISKGKFVLRIYNKKRKRADIQAELDLIHYLQGHQIAIPKLIPNLAKEEITISQNNFAVLFSFVKGTHPPWKYMNIKLANNIGIELALMHNFLLEFNPKLNQTSTLVTHFVDTSKLSKIGPEIVTYHNDIREELMDISLKKMRISIIHADITRENLIVKDNFLLAFLDFDDSHRDYLAWDLAIALTHLFIAKSFGIDWAGMRSFMSGYLSRFSLIKPEQQALLPFMKLRNLKLLISVYQKRKDLSASKKLLSSIEESALKKLELIRNNESKLKDFFGKVFNIENL
tara:strand:- start:1561 stop:2538 length:978 start_codon:yes stop_codon:yes gene_type:complete